MKGNETTVLGYIRPAPLDFSAGRGLLEGMDIFFCVREVLRMDCSAHPM